MNDIPSALLLLGIWIAIQYFIFPKLGVPG